MDRQNKLDRLDRLDIIDCLSGLFILSCLFSLLFIFRIAFIESFCIVINAHPAEHTIPAEQIKSQRPSHRLAKVAEGLVTQENASVPMVDALDNITAETVTLDHMTLST